MINSKYQKLLDEYNSLNEKLLDPSIFKDNRLLETTSKRVNELTDIINLIKELERYSNSIEESKKLLSDENFKELAEAEILEFEEKVQNLTKEIDEKLVKDDPMDSRNVIIEIRAGTGGDEASLFAGDLFRMYSRFSERMGWKIGLLNTNYSGTGGFKEVIFEIKGDKVYGKLKFESGVHRVQRVPATEASGRIHTSAASVVVLPEVDDLDIEIKPEDLRIDVFRSGGAGGQHVNKTESAVRITHTPSGIVVACQDERSQAQNKARAMSILKSKLYEYEEEKKMKEAKDIRKTSIGSGDRSAKIRTYNFPDSRVTDHRIKHTWHNLTQILDGDIDEILETVQREISNANDMQNED